ncbi:hypothetical protein V8Z74_14900 [Comamonas sp. w2-DMI]|uniref:hypothetical protein n=1 Tax=Comamonas sp. w2-DMI TaxID=3126391 RepID=UPI0032E39CC8
MDHIEEVTQEEKINGVVVGRRLSVELGTPVDEREALHAPATTKKDIWGFAKRGAKTHTPIPDAADAGVAGLGLMGERDEGRANSARKPPSRTKKYLLPTVCGVTALLLVIGTQLKTKVDAPSVSTDIAQLAPATPTSSKASAMPDMLAPEPSSKVVPDSVLGRVTSTGTGMPLESLEQVTAGTLPKALAGQPPAMPGPAGSVAVNAASAKAEPTTKPQVPQQPSTPLAAPQLPSQSTTLDKHSSSMDIPLTSDSVTSADIASLKQSAVPSTAPSSKLAKPLEEARVTEDKAEAKSASKPEAKVSAKDAVQSIAESPKVAIAAKKPDVVKSSDPKQVSVAKVERPRGEAKPRQQEFNQDRTKAKTAKNEREDADTAGFALPIREVHANGRPVSPAVPTTTPAEKAPIRYAEPRQNASRDNGRSSGTVEVVHVESAYALVTNPNTQLPMRVVIGGTLPNGAVVDGLDAARGIIKTNRGSYGMN